EIVKMPVISAITVDNKERRIYWLTTFPHYAIASTDYEGSGVRMVFLSCHFIHGYLPSIAVLDDP
ncbi:hypothetical protein AAVH_09065, partial [Aphelenchoides avenae]